MDETIRKYAAILKRIYDNRTAGVYTFQGVLAEFAREITREVDPNH